MSYLNKVMLIGRCGDPFDCTPLPSGISCFRARVGTTHHSRHDDKGSWSRETLWHNVVAYGGLAEKCGEHLTPGQMVYVEGSLQPDGNGGCTVECTDVHFLKTGNSLPPEEKDAC